MVSTSPSTTLSVSSTTFAFIFLINANPVFTEDLGKLKDTLGDRTELVDSLADFFLFILLKTDLCGEGNSMSSDEPLLVSADSKANIHGL